MAQATSKPVEVTYLPLTNWQDMAAALAAALTIGYAGVINAATDPQSGQPRWGITLTGPGNPLGAVHASIGDYILWDGRTVTVLAESEFNVRYTPVATP
jgi:hypothetical protein